MGDAGPVGLSQALLPDQASPVSRLASMRCAGAHRMDPARFHYMEVLSLRLQAQPAAVRRILEQRLQQVLAAYGERLQQARTTAEADAASLSGRRPALDRELRRLLADGDYAAVHRLVAQEDTNPPCTRLVGLNQHIRSVSKGQDEDTLGGDGDAATEMKSFRRFRETWRRIAADKQVRQAISRGPENAGPLNSHRLVLRSLAIMRGLSPDYLRRFMSHVDALLWLEQAGRKAGPVAGKSKAARRGRLQK